METYFRRDIDKELLKWKNGKEHIALEIIGARQIGKSTSIKHFVKNNYQNVIYIDLSESDGDYFRKYVENSGDKPVELLFKYFKKQNIKFTNDKNTVIVFDEIQASEAVWRLIRPINRGLECDFIVTGSSLSITKNWFYPAGDLKSIRMHTMSFSEFIDCFNMRKRYDTLEVNQFSTKFHSWLRRAYMAYCNVGGYPGVVKAFLNREDYKDKFKSILNVIYLEISNVLEPFPMRNLIDILLNSIIDLALREKKGDKNLIEHLNSVVHNIRPELRSSKSKIYTIIEWLIECDVLNYCDNYNLATGLTGSTQRLFFNDVGLLNYLMRRNNCDSGNIVGLLNETFVYKAFYNKVSDFNIYFGVYNEYEYDFILHSSNDIKIIEVKNSSERSKSIEKLIKEGRDYFFYFYFNNTRVQQDGKIKHLPIYLADKTILDDLSVQEDETQISVDYLLKDLNLF